MSGQSVPVVSPPAADSWSLPRHWLVLVAVLALTAIRLPSVLYRHGSQDEQWYAVPGWTVAREGIPRIPYAPVDAAESTFDGAHRILYMLPPAYFYLQAPFFWFFAAGYGTARLASLMSGAAALLLLYALVRQRDVRPGLALVALVLCALGRAFFFPWQDSRPDMLCGMFGVAAVLLTLLARESGRRRFAAAAGAACGLGLLSHPFAIIYTLQVGGLLLLSGQPLRRRLECVLAAGLCCLAALSLWGPLIAMEPKLFESQFVDNVIRHSGPGLFHRLLFPSEYLHVQIPLILERTGNAQAAAAVLVLIGGLLLSRSRQVLLALALAVSALYLHIATLGTHPAKGYLCYSWALMILLAATVLEELARRQTIQKRRWVLPLVVASLILIHLPGSGLRASWLYTARYRNPQYNVSLFCEELASRLPADSRLIVAPELVFEFERLGRRPVNASVNPFYQDVRGIPFDYLIVSRQSLAEDVPGILDSKLQWTSGDRDDPLSCYAEVHVPARTEAFTRDWPR